MTWQQFWTAVLILALIGIVLCVVILLFAAVSRWALDREDNRQRKGERRSAATFDRDYIPQAVDVAANERDLLEAGLVAGLEQAEAAWAEHCAEVRRLA